MVLWNLVRVSRCLFRPAKTRRTSKFKLCNVETTRLSLKFAQLGSIGSIHDGKQSVERYAVAVVANATHRHERSGHCRYLENRLQIATLIREIERTLAKVGDCTSDSRLIAEQHNLGCLQEHIHEPPTPSRERLRTRGLSTPPWLQGSGPAPAR